MILELVAGLKNEISVYEKSKRLKNQDVLKENQGDSPYVDREQPAILTGASSESIDPVGKVLLSL